MAFTQRRARQESVNFWPGYVDALATLLLIMIFLLVIFAAARFFVREAMFLQEQELEQTKTQVSTLSTELDQSKGQVENLEKDKQSLETDLATTKDAAAKAETKAQELESSVATLESDKAAQSDRISALETDLAKANAALEDAKAEEERLGAMIASLKEQAAAAAAEIDGLKASLDAEVTSGEKSKEEIARLLALLEAAEKDKALAGSEIDTLKASAAKQKEEGEEAQAQLSLLKEELASLRVRLQGTEESLNAAQAKAAEDEAKISALTKELDEAKAASEQAIAQYQSDFFAQLVEALGQRDDIEVVGDRFILQSEVLFDSGSAEIKPAGRENLRKIASVLKDISQSIPADINWILRVDGHSDKQPISSSTFPSNWHLSSARAINVVTFLIQNGVPPKRLVAAGFGEFQPLDPGSTAASYKRNRRIEFKLTNR